MRKDWFRDLDSNQDTQLQRLMSYRLDDPGMAGRNCSRGMQACTDGADGNGEAAARVESRGGGRRVRVPTVSAKLLKPVHSGEVSERFKEHAWKACVGEILPWVQIPPSPPNFVRQILYPRLPQKWFTLTLPHCGEVAKLFRGGSLVEVQALAVVPELGLQARACQLGGRKLWMWD